MLGVKITRSPRPPRKPRAPHLAWRVAGWNPALAATIVVLAGLVVHEIVYHLTGGDDYPLQVLADGSPIVGVSHGGLDGLGVGALVIGVLWLIDFARTHARRPA